MSTTIDTEVTIWYSTKTGRLEYICERGLKPKDVSTVCFMYAIISGVHAELLAITEGVERDVTTVIELDPEDNNSTIVLRYHNGWYSFTIKVDSAGLPKRSLLMLTNSVRELYTSTT